LFTPSSSIRYTRGPPTLAPPYVIVSASIPAPPTEMSEAPDAEVWFDNESSAMRFFTAVHPAAVAHCLMFSAVVNVDDEDTKKGTCVERKIDIHPP
jgi:hypothetical protein